jgi:hypothetical protein
MPSFLSAAAGCVSLHRSYTNRRGSAMRGRRRHGGGSIRRLQEAICPPVSEKGEAAGARDGLWCGARCCIVQLPLLRRRGGAVRGSPRSGASIWRLLASVSNPSIHISVSWTDSVICSNFYGFRPAPNQIQSFRISATRSVADYAGAGSVLVGTVGIVGTPIPCILSIVHKQQNRSKWVFFSLISISASDSYN